MLQPSTGISGVSNFSRIQTPWRVPLPDGQRNGSACDCQSESELGKAPRAPETNSMRSILIVSSAAASRCDETKCQEERESARECVDDAGYGADAEMLLH